LICYCYSFFIASSVIHFTSVAIQVISVAETTLTMGLFAWSYYGAVCRDPGYLPYDWERTRRTKYTWQELMTGTAVVSTHLTAELERPLRRCPIATSQRERAEVDLRIPINSVVRNVRWRRPTPCWPTLGIHRLDSSKFTALVSGYVCPPIIPNYLCQ
jgi:hypothetical protein